MAAPLRRVLVCTPDAAGYTEPRRWRELGYFHEPVAEAARAGHRALVAALERAGADVLELPRANGLTLDAVYAHDASFPTNHGMILMSMGKPARRDEPEAHRRFFEAAGIPVLGAIEPPGTTEGGDMVWLDETTLLIGEGYRTNASGIAQVRALLAPHGVDVIAAPLPYGPGPDACLHLMSLMSILDSRAALVDLPWLAVPTVTLLEERGFELIPMPREERDTMACNVLALGDNRLLALEENRETNRLLTEAGYDVATYPGAEISLNGSGGPTCLTRPLLRG